MILPRIPASSLAVTDISTTRLDTVHNARHVAPMCLLVPILRLSLLANLLTQLIKALV